MNVEQLKVKFLDLKSNLENSRTLGKLKENNYDLNKLNETIEIYLKNIQTIESQELLLAMDNKINNLLNYTRQSNILDYIHSFENDANFLISNVPKDIQTGETLNNLEITEEEFTKRFNSWLNLLNLENEDIVSNYLLKIDNISIEIYRTSNNNVICYYKLLNEKKEIHISLEELIKIVFNEEDGNSKIAKVIASKITDNTIFDSFIKNDSSELFEVLKNKLSKNENDILVLKNNLEKLQEENQLLVNTKIKLDEIIDKSKVAQEEYTFAKNAAIDDAKLKKSLKYWEIKQKRHNRKFWIFMAMAITLIFVLIGFLYYEIYSYKSEKKESITITPISSNISDKSKDKENSLNNKSDEKEQKNIPNELKIQKEGKDNKSLQIDVNIQIENLTKQEELNKELKETLEKKDESFIKDLEDSNLPWYFLMIFATSSTFWIIRIIVKIALSNLHLSEDAHERVVMIYTYLSFIQKGQLQDEKEDKKLILSSLFRPSNIGIIQDESSVTVTDIITAFKK